MKPYIDQVKAYIQNHTQEIKVGAIALGGILVVVLFIALYIYNTESRRVKMDYRPVAACALFTSSEAKELLGDDIIDKNTNQATVSGNRAASKCSYTDKNMAAMAVIAVAVQSAVNDNGVQDNKDDFAAKKAANTVETVTGVGEEAFYVPANGQLNILDGRGWILIRYGIGDNISTYTLENAMKVAKKVIDQAT